MDLVPHIPHLRDNKGELLKYEKISLAVRLPSDKIKYPQFFPDDSDTPASAASEPGSASQTLNSALVNGTGPSDERRPSTS
jgi:hypothetical protein